LESGNRKLLNFGHTIGHAIEALSLDTNKPLLHGEAVAIGMVGESKLANLIGLLPKSDLMLIKESIKKIGLPIKIKNIAKEKVLGKIINDKKNIRGKILWSLPKKVGRANINIEVEKRFVTEAIEYIFD
jgi:3-dehydroquinate synthase